ncbi:TIGR03757 family integrating conjugative element protein [Klebsiella variicola]|uniref:TIGR03757 family integrating conjugative element protein n=1 Tax=Klebsiella variicola TaxID=244366 RepID=UPI0012B6B5CA|nr:TIGR03757 family integrating conjugative element protein [Klebsiella variicola]
MIIVRPLLIATTVSLTLPATAATEIWLTRSQSEAAAPFPAGITVHIIDEAARLQAEFFAPVTRATSPADAQQAAMAVFSAPDWPQREARLRQALETVARARSLGIEKTPAIVMEDRLVIYGSTDVPQAQQLARQARQGGAR